MDGDPPVYGSYDERLALDLSAWLDDVDPDDIERIEVLSGPSAATRFGSGAGNGALLITTRSGGAGSFRVASHVSFGTTHRTSRFPASYSQLGVTTTGVTIDGCGLVWQSWGICEPIEDSLLVTNALE